jgi:hypothetical protein
LGFFGPVQELKDAVHSGFELHRDGQDDILLLLNRKIDDLKKSRTFLKNKRKQTVLY